MKQRHGIEDSVVVRQVSDRKHLPHIGEDIAMADHDALGIRRRAGGVADNDGRVGVGRRRGDVLAFGIAASGLPSD